MTTLAMRRLFSGLRARYHAWNGRRAYRAGRLRTAGRHLDLAISHGHQSFGAYLLLGKVAYRERDMQRAMDCFRLARRTDPTRYALEGFPAGFIESLGRHPAHAARQKYRIVIEPTGAEETRGARDRRPLQDALKAREPGRAESGRASEPLGDFKSRDEQEKARGLPRLRPGEWADIDWDLEARKLFGD